MEPTSSSWASCPKASNFQRARQSGFRAAEPRDGASLERIRALGGCASRAQPEPNGRDNESDHAEEDAERRLKDGGDDYADDDSERRLADGACKRDAPEKDPGEQRREHRAEYCPKDSPDRERHPPIGSGHQAPIGGEFDEKG